MARVTATPDDLSYWGVISSAAAARVTTAELWQRIRAQVQRLGPAAPTPTFAGITALRSLATSQRRAMTSLGRAADNSALTADHIAQDVSSRSLAEQALAPQYLVRFETEWTVGEERFTRWLTQTISEVLPASKGDLMSMLDEVAPDLAVGSDFAPGSPTGRVVITAV